MSEEKAKNTDPSRADKEALLGEYAVWSVLDLIGTVGFRPSLGFFFLVAVGCLIALLGIVEFTGSKLVVVIGLILPLPLYLLKKKANAKCAELKQRLLEENDPTGKDA